MDSTKEGSVQNAEGALQPDVGANIAQKITMSSKSFLFHYVTMLVSGLILVSLLSLTGGALLNHWLGEQGPANMLSGFEYYFYIYLLVSLVLFGGLHIWMRMCVRGAVEDEHASAVRVFRAIFLTILAVTIVGSIGVMAYVGVDSMLGTGDYSVKSTWLIMLDSMQVILWSALLWWYFKQSRIRAVVYSAAVAILVALMAILLLVLPIFSKRDAVIDSRTSADLSSIVAKVNEYTRKNNKLPASLNDVKLDEKVASRIAKYEYQPGAAAAPKSEPTNLEEYLNYSPSSSDSFSYKLCATFKTDTAKDKEETTFLSYFGGSGMSKHPAGHHCFDETAYGGGEDGAKPTESIQSLLNTANTSAY